MTYSHFYKLLADPVGFWGFLCEKPINFFVIFTNPYIWIGLGPFFLTLAFRTASESKKSNLNEYTDGMRNVIFMFIHYFSFLVGLLSLSIHLVVYTFDVYRYANNFYISALLLGIAGCIAVFTIGHNAFFLDDKLLNKYKSHGDGFMPPISAFNFVRIAFFWIAVYISWMTEFHMEILAKLPRVVG